MGATNRIKLMEMLVAPCRNSLVRSGSQKAKTISASITTNAKQTVLDFWERMRSNDFYYAAELLAPDFMGMWPQSAELIRGRKNFAKVNSVYPANGRWQFELNSIVAEGNQVVTDVSISDGEVKVRAITFSTVVDGLIAKQTEFWPDPMPAAEWRREWIEIMDD